MHKSTKIPPALRKEIFTKWKKDGISQRQLAKEYHVDKRVIGRIIERGKIGEFDVRSSINHRYLQKRPRSKKTAPKKAASKKMRNTTQSSSARSSSRSKRSAKK